MAAGEDPAKDDFGPGDYLMMTMIMNTPLQTRGRQTARLDDEPLFKSAHAALTFALNYSMQQYDRPLMNRIAAGELTAGMVREEGLGLSGLAGAGQAGMIRAKLAKLTPLQRAVLVVSTAPAQVPCECRAPCCSGRKTNPEWQEAMATLSVAAAAEALSGCVSNGRLRSALIQRLLGAKASLADLAERHDVSERTAEGQSAKLRRWLFGSAARGGAEAQEGLHGAAYRLFSTLLVDAGLVGCKEK